MDNHEQEIGKLNGFLRGEIAAVETYRKALEIAQLDALSRVTLTECLTSHERRVEMIASEIRRLGGVPVTGSGVWGAFARLVEQGATALGADAAVAALEEGEGIGSVDYQRMLYDVPQPTRSFLTTLIIPEQRRTLEAVRAVIPA